jgi:hypothetical protein
MSTSSNSQNIYIPNYKLGACYCRNNALKGGVCTFVEHNLNFSNVNLNCYCIEKDIEICATSLRMVNTNLYVYRSATRDFGNFLQNPDGILRKLYAKNCALIICGDLKINYLKADLKEKILLSTMHASYNLFSTVKCPIGIQNNHIYSIHNVFINFTRMTNSNIFPFINGLSGHDARYLSIHNVNTINFPLNTKSVRTINTDSIHLFISH